MTNPEQYGISSERLARIRPALAKYIDTGHISGVTTLLSRQGEIIHRETMGWMDR